MIQSQQPVVEAFFDQTTNTISYVAFDPQRRVCAVIDSVLDFDYASGRISFESADKIIAYIRANDLTLEWIIETHVHADHLSAAPYIQNELGGKIGIGQEIVQVQETFGKVFNEGTEFQRDGSQFDKLFADGDEYHVGDIAGKVMHTPGHTPACTTHLIGDAAFTGDTLFMPDGVVQGVISPADRLSNCMIPFNVFCRCRTKHGCSCAMTTGPMAVNSMGNQRSGRKGSQHPRWKR